MGRGSRSVAGAAVVITCCVLPVASCGSAQEGAGGLSGTDAQAAGAVAVRYTQAVASEPAAGRELVLPSDRHAFDILGRATPRGERVTATDLAAGTVTVSGHDATVVITGTLCLTVPADPEESSSTAGTRCESNRDPRSVDPVFTVHLTQDGNDWYVYYPRPLPPTGSPSLVPAPAPPTAS